MQLTRLFETVYLLLEHKTITARELAAHFEVSVRTIYRDLEVLSQAGIPVYASKGRGGGLGILDSFVLNKSVLSEEEKHEILWALQGADGVNALDGGQTLAKLSSFFGLPDTDWISIDFSDWTNSRQNLFYTLKDAITLKRLVEFDYYNSNGEKSHRIAAPIKLCFKDKAWYLTAFCKKSMDYRFFKITRIRNLASLEVHFERNFPSAKQLPERTPPFESLSTVILKIDSRFAYRVYDEFDDEHLKVLDDGSFLTSLTCPEDSWMYSYILSYGPFIKVIEPKRIEEIIVGMLKEALAQYGE